VNALCEKVACIDLEGVLVPEMWPYIAERTGVNAFRETTRDVSDYQSLMAKRISALRQHDLRLQNVQEVLSEITPFPDAMDFLSSMSDRYSVRILSDCFHEIADPVLGMLGRPISMCHRLIVDEDGFVVRCEFALRRGKEDVVAAFLGAGAEVVAVGDALNDLEMLKLATAGFLVRPSEQTRAVAPSRVRIVDRLDEITDVLF
jgi:phosphoserine / homoserine phosphotransferase